MKEVDVTENPDIKEIDPDEYNMYMVFGEQLPVVDGTEAVPNVYRVEITYDLDGDSYKDFGFVYDLDKALKLLADEIMSDESTYSGRDSFDFMIDSEHRKILLDFDDPNYYGRITY